MADSKPVSLVPHKHPLTNQQRKTLDSLCDLMIPASVDGMMPAASELDLFDNVSDMAAETVTLFSRGLDALDTAAQEQHQKHFDALGQTEAQVVVDAVRPQARGFFGVFAVQNVARYHRHDKVMPLIGLEARPPWPKGNTVEDGDWSLLDAVRARAPFYRTP